MIPQVFLGGDGAGGGEYKNWIPHRESHQNLISKIFNWLPALADFNCPSKKKTDGCNLSSLGLNLMILGGLKEQIINRVSPPSLSTGNWSRHVVRVVSNHGSFPHLKHTCFAGLLTAKTDMTMEKNNHLKSFEDVFPCISYLAMLVYWRIRVTILDHPFFIVKTSSRRPWGA